MSNRQKKLPIATLERIDDLCAEFERQWQVGPTPDIEANLPSDLEETEKNVLLAELIVLDIDYRRRRGENPQADDYTSRFPALAEDVQEELAENSPRARAFQPPTVGALSQLFPKLEIIQLIGAGGMGAVYKAKQTGLDRMVALKILPEEFGHDVKFALRFTREARTLAKLSHPNIVSVFEFGQVENTYYFLMEYVDGSTLRDVVKAGTLDPKHALAIVPHLCDALQYAHDKGVIHRDIKPENILLATDGAVKIADFGLSRILGNDGQQELLTGTHQVMGTPRYMAPEQLEGARGVDHRADIYSLGVVFYEMLTGELPIGRFAAPSKKVEIDVRLDEVVLRTLEKEPQRRYQRASQIKSDVQSITSGIHPSFTPTIAHENQNDFRQANRSSDTDQLQRTEVSYSVEGGSGSTVSLAQQELAGRMILTRRQLMERVEKSLRPLFRGQMFQVVFGVALIALGVQCWALNTQILHRVICGVILHVYGVLVIAQSMWVVTRIRGIDYSKPVAEIRASLDRLRSGYLRAGVLVGFVWWLMWLPVCVAFRFDAVLLPYSLGPSLIIGIPGFVISVWLYLRALKSKKETAEALKRRLAGESISTAYLTLDEIEQAQIQ